MKYFNQLKEAMLEEDFYETNDVIGKIKREENGLEYISAIFGIMEKNPNVDYGIPGPIVHFMETYYKKGYEDLLLQSVINMPTSHTVWMLNRVMNDPTLVEKSKYLEVLKNSLSRDDIPKSVKEEIKEFIEYQEN